MSKTLVLLRHAKSAWPEGVPDHERPLADRGQADAPVAGRWLATNVAAVDHVACSPATRARQTWDLARAELDPPPPTRYEEQVYAASPGDLLAVVHDLPDDADTAILVGHNPGLSFLITLLAGVHHELKTSAIAVLRWEGSWRDGGGGGAELVTTAKPRG